MVTTTKLDRDLFVSNQCLKVLKSMREHQVGEIFDELVVTNPNYFSVISKPIDFVIIKSKLDKNHYRNTFVEFPKDVRLVFSNASRYYPPENPVHKYVKKLEQVFEIRWESVKQRLVREFPGVERTRAETSKASSLVEKVSSSHAARIRIRFADIIEKSKHRKLVIDESSSNKSDVKVKIQKEKQLLGRRQHQEKTRTEGENIAVKLRLQRRRRQERFSLKKMEEEARSKMEICNLEAEKELVNLCGGSFLATIRWVEVLGLVLRSDDDDDCLKEMMF